MPKIDPLEMILQAFVPLFQQHWGFFFLLFIFLPRFTFVKGILGEFQVNIIAKLQLDKNIYHLIKNVTLPTKDGGTTQLDHIIVSPYGVFVIETKNMKGWIYGGKNDRQWNQKIYRHSQKFQNPLLQNYKHTETLRITLGLDTDKVFSLIVFIGDSQFKTNMPDNVVYAGEYVDYIKSKTTKVFTDLEVRSICSQIESGRLSPTIKTHINHVKHVKSIVEQKQQSLDKNACHKCGSPMIIKTARESGNQFFACSAFPKCKTTRPIKSLSR